MDLTEGIFWAASPPNQLGKFVAFDVNDFARELPERTLAANPMMVSSEYEKARQAQQSLADAKRALRGKRADEALKLADKAEVLNPGFYLNAALRGRALLALGRKDDAAKAFDAALAAKPAFLDEKREIEGFLRRARGTKNLGQDHERRDETATGVAITRVHPGDYGLGCLFGFGRADLRRVHGLERLQRGERYCSCQTTSVCWTPFCSAGWLGGQVAIRFSCWATKRFGMPLG